MSLRTAARSTASLRGRAMIALAVMLLGGCADAARSAPSPACGAGSPRCSPSPACGGGSGRGCVSDATPPARATAPLPSPPPQAGDGDKRLPNTDPAQVVDYTCNTDADCAIKNVGNCCGQYLACVNRNSPTFPDQVKADCAREGRSAICGYPSLAGCVCREHRCEGVNGPSATPEVR